MFGTILSFVSGIVNVIGGILREKIKDDTVVKQIEAEIQSKLLEYAHNYMELNAKTVFYELQGKWYQRLWRPLLMYVIIFIIFNNYILYPYLHMIFPKIQPLQFPNEFWNILMISLGGYLPLRTYEKKMMLDRLEKMLNTFNNTINNQNENKTKNINNLQKQTKETLHDNNNTVEIEVD